MFFQPLTYLSRNVGLLRSDGVFITHRKPEHIFRKFSGLGVSFKVLKELVDNGCRKIVIILHRDDGTEAILSAKPTDFLEKGTVYVDGADAQRILSIQFLAQSKLEAAK